MVQNNDRADVMSHYKVVGGLDLWNIIISTAVCVVLVLQIRTRSLNASITRLPMPKTIFAPDTSSLKPGSGATEGVLD